MPRLRTSPSLQFLCSAAAIWLRSRLLRPTIMADSFLRVVRCFDPLFVLAFEIMRCHIYARQVDAVGSRLPVGNDLFDLDQRDLAAAWRRVG